MEQIDFNCTMCGKCCNDLRLPLTVDESAAWLARGGQIQVLCEAVPWPEEPDAANLKAQHKRRRSFAAASGSLPVRVVVILAAAFAGPCPNLQADNRCGIYAERPLVCRIYPAEINPFVPLAPSNKACPPEAWAPSMPFVRQGEIVDAELRGLIARSRNADERDAPRKAALCAALGIDRAALANEGFVVFSPAPATLRAALSDVDAGFEPPPGAFAWSIVSNQRKTIDVLISIGAIGEFADGVSDSLPRSYEYLGFLAPSTTSA
jgi:Fe-S-cluster containining protein